MSDDFRLPWPWDAKDPPPVPDPPRCITYIACPTIYRAECRAAQRCIGEDEMMG
jgi:hypothetical protein